MKRLAAFATLCAVALLPMLAAGQTSVTVLGLRAPAADEDVARTVTEALRQAAESASAAGSLQHSGRENDLAQLMIAFGCDEPTTACLRQIGEGLSTDRLIYGRLERRPGRGDASYTVTLALFNVETGAVDRTLQEVIPSDMLAGDAVIGPVSRFYGALTGIVVRGELAIRCNVAGATVTIGGEEVGTTTAEPLVLRDLTPGEVTVSVRHDDYAAFEETVTVEAGRLVELSAELGALSVAGGGGDGGGDVGDDGGDDGGDDVVAVPLGPGTERPRSLAWLGWTLIGAGVVFGGLGLWSSLEVYYSGYAEGGILFAERDCWAGSDGWTVETGDLVDCPGAPAAETHEEAVDDVFARIEEDESVQPRSGITRDELFSELDRVGLHETLQFVFYGLAVVSVGVGIYLVIREAMRPAADEDEASAFRLSFSPMVWDGGGAFTARLQF